MCRELKIGIGLEYTDTFAKRHGHTVLRLSPYHCVFNPTEMI